MAHRRSSSIRGQAFTLALVIGLSLSGVGLVAAGAAAPPSRQSCPVTPSPVSPGQTVTASPSPSDCPTTASPTASATPTPTVTTTVTSAPTTIAATVTVTGSASPTTGSPGPSTRSITLEANKRKLTYPRNFALSGGLTAGLGACVSSQSVRIFRTVVGADSQELFDTVTTNADGTFSKSFASDRSANYIAHVDGSETCGEANSVPVPVLVRVKVNLRISDTRVPRGAKIRLRTKVAPCDGHQRTKVVLFRVLKGDFAKVDTARLSKSCKASFTRRVRKATAYQVRWPKQHSDHLRGNSTKKAIRLVR